MRRASDQSEITIPASEQVHDCLCRRPFSSFGRDDVSQAANRLRLMLTYQHDTQLAVERDDPTRVALRCLVREVDGVATFAAGSGTTLSDALADIAARFTAANDAAGESVT